MRTTCPYCGVGCGVVALSDDDIVGDREHPSNFGRLCSKGAALKETLDLKGRLLQPLISGRNASWDEALDLIATRFRAAARSRGPDSIAFYLSGQLLTEDYYVANKLMKGFIGSANVDTNSRLCMASSVAGHIRAFGEDLVPGTYEDIEETDLAVLVGSNMAWCHPVLYQRLIAAHEKRGTKLVVIDPRRTPTCETADLHLAIRAGSDVLLFLGLLDYLDRSGAVDRTWLEAHVTGYEGALHVAQAAVGGTLHTILGVEEASLLAFYELFAQTPRAITFYSQGVNQSAVGTDKVNAIINCHLATGRIGKPGSGPFSLTGQPNAMGGREVGGLANQLAAHMNFSDSADIDRVRRFWNAPNIATRPGLKAVDLFDAVSEGKIEALWIAATNPAASMPNAEKVRAALRRCPFVVVSDCWPTDTTALADVVLPAAAWAEKSGTVTNSERRISRQRAFRAAPTDTRPDWQAFAEVGRRMGWCKEFAFDSPASIFREHARLSAFENNGRRFFDIGRLAALDDDGYDKMAPRQWPCPERGTEAARLFADGQFPTRDGRAHMVATPFIAHELSHDVLRLNTGRVRDQWHTMTRTGRVSRLMRHCAEPVLELHPHDAATRSIRDGDLVSIKSDYGRTALHARVSADQREGEVFAPMHWTDQFLSAGPISRLVNPNVDPVSGQPDLKSTPVLVSAIAEVWRGLLMHANDISPENRTDVYWSKAPLPNGWAVRLSGWKPLSDFITSEDALRRLLCASPTAEIVTMADARKGIFRYASIEKDRVEALLFFAPARERLPDGSATVPMLGARVDPSNRMRLLSGGSAVESQIVCSCFSVSGQSLRTAIASGGVETLYDVERNFRAGTNCGSCIPELKAILRMSRRTSEGVGVD